jgi:putative transposase
MDRGSYPSDLTDEQWEKVAPLIPVPGSGGRRRELDMREIVNAILYLLQTDCGWRGLPACFPNRSSVRTYYDRWRRDGTWEQIRESLGLEK